MSRRFSWGLLWVAILILALALYGCSGGNSGASEAAAPLAAQTYNEGCALCHRATSIADVAVVHSTEDNSPEGEITGVSIVGGLVTVDFMLFDSENNLVPIAGVAASGIRFSLAKLVATGSTSNWQSYINTTETKAAGAPGNAPDGTPTPDGTSQIQSTAERANTAGGLFLDNGDGTYSYRFSFNITTVTTPLAVAYQSDQTHRIAMQVSDNVANAFVDFVPDTLPTLDTSNLRRDVVTNASCNECHIKLGLHGGDRIQVQYCVTCHNPGTTDANSGNTVDFKVMVHKIHAGENGADVTAGGEYAIWGFNNSKNDYSTVVYPQDLRNCTKCHDGADAATPDGDNWKDAPSTAACTSCHEDPASPTYPGFPNLTSAEIEAAHQIPSQIAAAAFEYNILSITDPGGERVDPGDLVKVTFSVTDPTNADAPYDISADPAFTAGGGASRLAILIGWDSADINNTGSGSAPAQPISLNPLSGGATNNLNGTFSVTSTQIVPLDVTGSGVAAIEGHPAGDYDNDGTFSDRVPVKSAFQYFPIGSAVVSNRRVIVNINNCNQCHEVLSLHGNNRTNEPQVCVICHNGNATDIEVRPANAATNADGKVEEAVDFKYMIHAIHAGAAEEHGFRENGIVVYGFGGSVNDFSEVRMPAGLDNLKNCSGCHTGTTFAVPLNANALPTTILTGAREADPDDDTNITPTAAVCSSCHDDIDSKTHMSEQGGQFDYKAFAPAQTGSGGDQAALCGPGPVSSQPAGHTTRTDCCSCHGFN